MGEIITYLTPCVLFGLGIKYRRSNCVTISFGIYFWILIGLNTKTPDYETYKWLYEASNTVSTGELGYSLLNKIIHAFGLSYQQFRMVYATIYSVLTVFTAKRLHKHTNFILALFLLWPFISSVSGLRNTMASMIVCFCIPFLLEKGWKGLIKYTIGVCLAASFHFTAFFFLVFVFARRKFHLLDYLIILCTMILTAILLETNTLISLVENVSGGLGEKLKKWLSGTATGIGELNFVGFTASSLSVIGTSCVVCALANQIMKTAKKAKVINIEKKRTIIQKYTLLHNISCLIVLTVPGFFVSSEYGRFMGAVLIVYYAVFAEFWFGKVDMQPLQKTLYKVASIMVVLFLAAYYIYSMRSHNIFATLTDNLLFQLI